MQLSRENNISSNLITPFHISNYIIIGVGRLRILGGGGARGGEQIPSRHMTSCAHKVFNISVPNNNISHLKIGHYRKFKNRIERTSFASTFKSN